MPTAEFFHELVSTYANYIISLFEFIGVTVLLVSGIQGIYHYVKKDPMTRLKLAKGMSMGLEFKLGSEILRTVVVREISECLIVAFIIVLRAALTFLIHWEIKNEEEAHASSQKNQDLQDMKKMDTQPEK